MNRRPRQWLIDGRPRLGLVFLAGAVASGVVLLAEGVGPGYPAGAPFRHFDKLLHFGAHAWISALAYTGLVLLGRPASPRLRAWLAAVVVLVADGLTGITVEFVQYTLGAEHGRVFDWKDIAANLAGTIAATGTGLAITIWLLPSPAQIHQR